MSWVAAASVAGAVGGSLIGADATRSASNKANDASAAANELQRYMYDTTRSDQEPYRNAGYDALKKLTGFQDPSVSASDVMNEPGYQFGLQQGLGSLQNTAAARGGLYSGATGKALTQYGNDYASSKYNDAFNRMQTDASNRWGRMAGLAGIGQAAQSQVNAAGSNYANQASNIGLSNAGYQGAAGMQNANIWGNALSSLVSNGNRANWWQNGGTSRPVQGIPLDEYGG